MTIKLTLYPRIFLGIQNSDTSYHGAQCELFHAPVDAYEFYALLPTIKKYNFDFYNKSPSNYFFFRPPYIFSLNLQVLLPEETHNLP